MTDKRRTICLFATMFGGTLNCSKEASAPSPADPTPETSPAPKAPTDPPVLVGAGDIAACDNDHDEATAALLDTIAGTVFTLGDNAYPDGTASDFANCYDPTWGRHKERTRPSPGNHEYRVEDAAGYFDYFGNEAGPSDRGYYAYELGSWRIYSLNSEANLEAQADWLRRNLDSHPSECVLAYWHQPLFSSGEHGPETDVRPLFEVLYEAGAEVVLSGHDHDYERFAPQTPDGQVDWSRGITQFVVGTGGKSLRPFEDVLPNSEVRYAGGYGVLKLTLDDSTYTWQFISAAGQTFTDAGSRPCH